MMLFRLLSWPYLRKHLLRWALTLAGIVLGDAWNEPGAARLRPAPVRQAPIAIALTIVVSTLTTYAGVKALDKKFVALKGFMLPLKVEGGLITELLIMRDQSMCCYGTVPKINEWVSVKMTGKGVKPIMDQAVTLYGKLHVGEIRENGYLVGIYQMDGEKVAGPLDL